MPLSTYEGTNLIHSGTVTSIERIEETQTMYNLTVDTAHTFFVGEGEWLVHNTDCSVSWLNRQTLPANEVDAINSTIENIRAGTRPSGFNRNNHWGGSSDVYRNNFGDLPTDTTYRIYDVPAPAGDSTRGTRRIIVGENDKWYYTNTHYGRDDAGNPTTTRQFFRIR